MENRRVLITDAQERSAAAACQILRRAGYRVGAASSVRPAPGQWSRYCQARFSVSNPRNGERRFVEEIVKIVDNHDYAVIIPGADVSLLALSRHREAFNERIDLGIPPTNVVEACVSRVNLNEAASDSGLAPPETLVCETPDDAFAAASELGFPVLLKPRSTVFERNGGLSDPASLLTWDAAALQERLPEFGFPCLMQRRESGALVSFSGVFAEGRLLGVVVSRYRRTWPPDAGSVSFSETVAAPASLINRVRSFLEAVGWQGIFELELIERGPESFGAIDFNPRLYGSLALAARAGVPLPAIWCDWLLGREVPMQRAEPGFYYRWEDAEMRNFIRAVGERRFRDAASILRPRRRCAHAFFRWDDPGPLVARAVGAIWGGRSAKKYSQRKEAL
jgi:predicted ATP-grasp superfamily ATP-dependent carboligase